MKKAHYDYWSNSFKHSILLDSQANLICYGMGEKSIVQIADALDSGMDVKDITYIPGTVFKTRDLSLAYDPIILPSFDEMKEDKLNYAKSFKIQSENTDPYNGKTLVEPYPNGVYVVQNHLRSHLPKWKWMMFMICHMREHIILYMKRMEAYLLFRKLNFPLQVVGDVLGHVVFAH